MPLDRQDAAAGSVALPVVVGGKLDAPRTMLFLTGGPGQGGVAAAERVIPRFAAVGAEQRIVLLDQRGTGAGAISCPALQQQMRSSDLAVPSEDAVTSCAATVGANRAHYATSDTVADLEDLRAALGAERWSLDGVSYGSYVAQRYAAAHPDRVDRLVLDSVVPVTGFDPLLTDVYPEVARVLRAVCAASGCGGDPADALNATVRRWPDLSPVLLDLVTGMSVADPDVRRPGAGTAAGRGRAGPAHPVARGEVAGRGHDAGEQPEPGPSRQHPVPRPRLPLGRRRQRPRRAGGDRRRPRRHADPGPAVPVRRDRGARQRRGRHVPGLAPDPGLLVRQ